MLTTMGREIERDTGKFSEASSPKWLVIPANTVVEKVTSDIPPGLYGNFFALELDKWVGVGWSGGGSCINNSCIAMPSCGKVPLNTWDAAACGRCEEVWGDANMHHTCGE